MANEILILRRGDPNSGMTEYTFAFLVPSTPRSGGGPVAYTPTEALGPELSHLSQQEKDDIDAGKLIVEVGQIGFNGDHTIEQVRSKLQAKFEVAKVRVPARFADTATPKIEAGDRFDAQRGRP